MTLIEHYQRIKGLSVDMVLADPEALKSLLLLASALLLNGGSPTLCNSCIIDYYRKIINNFDELLNYEAMKNRTCKPKWVGIKYVKGAFFDSETITDEKALNAIKTGYLTEKDFEILPEIKENDEIELIEENSEEEIEKEPVKRGRKSKKE